MSWNKKPKKVVNIDPKTGRNKGGRPLIKTTMTLDELQQDILRLLVKLEEYSTAGLNQCSKAKCIRHSLRRRGYTGSLNGMQNKLNRERVKAREKELTGAAELEKKAVKAILKGKLKFEPDMSDPEVKRLVERRERLRVRKEEEQKERNKLRAIRAAANREARQDKGHVLTALEKAGMNWANIRREGLIKKRTQNNKALDKQGNKPKKYKTKKASIRPVDHLMQGL